MTAAALLAAVGFWPALHGGITPEDFGWLVAARQLDNPWPLLAGNPYFVYFYRPLPLLLWWLSGQAWGTNALAHHAVDLVLHALNAALVARLAGRLSGRTEAAWIAGLVFACLPCGAGTALWLSDRFDPVALACGLGALLAFERALAQQRGRLALALLLLGALLSKETAYAVAGWLLLRLLWRAWRRRERRADLWLAVALPILAAALLRLASGTAVDTSLPITDVPAAALGGITAWWLRLPHALFAGFDEASGPVGPPAYVWPVLLALGGLLAYALPRLRAAKDGSATLALTGAALLCATPLLQWPVTRLALLPPGYALTVNLRFYYLAAAALALLLGAAATVPGPRARVLGLGLLLMLGAGGLWRTRAVGEAWTARFAADGARQLVLAGELAAREWPRGCRLLLDAASFNDDFRVHADTIAKAAAAPGAPLMSCAVFAGTRVVTTVVDGALCRAEDWPGLTLSQAAQAPVIARLGKLCTLQFTSPPPADDPRAVRLRVDAQGHLHDPS